nr:MAG TPA: hypothetical protein [Caudoviricetes sp.]
MLHVCSLQHYSCHLDLYSNVLTYLLPLVINSSHARVKNHTILTNHVAISNHITKNIT